MATTAPSKRQIRTNSVPSGQGLAEWLRPFLRSSVGGKYLVALTGLVLTGFVIGHMLGNLQVFLGPDRINAYAESLKNLGLLLWAVRLFLLAAFVVHIALALWLNWRSRQARPVGYAYERTVQASFASRHMVTTGLVVLVFTVFHIAHFTLGAVKGADVVVGRTLDAAGEPQTTTRHLNYLELRDAKGRHDVYSMMIYGFKEPVIAILYLVAQVFLFLHLVHGVGSMFQSVGLNAPRAQRLIRGLAWAVALLVCVGNAAIVAGVWLGPLQPSPHIIRPEGATPQAPQPLPPDLPK